MTKLFSHAIIRKMKVTIELWNYLEFVKKSSNIWIGSTLMNQFNKKIEKYITKRKSENAPNIEICNLENYRNKLNNYSAGNFMKNQPNSENNFINYTRDVLSIVVSGNDASETDNMLKYVFEIN